MTGFNSFRASGHDAFTDSTYHARGGGALFGIWHTDFDEQRLYELEPEFSFQGIFTGVTVIRSIDAPDQPYDVGGDHRVIWLISEDGSLARTLQLDPVDFSIVKSFPEYTVQDRGVGGTQRVIWLTGGSPSSGGPDDYAQIDPDTGAVLQFRSISDLALHPDGAGGDLQRVWGSSANAPGHPGPFGDEFVPGSHFELDPDDLSVVQFYHLGYNPWAIGEGRTHLWETTTDVNFSKIFELDPVDMTRLGQSLGPGATPAGIGGGP